MGALLDSQNIDSGNIILGDYNSGIYIVSIQKNGKRVVEKVIVN